MRIAYIISAYKRPDQLTRLVNKLHTPTSVFLIHVDKRTEQKQYRDMVSGIGHLSNVIFLKRHNCHWGDFGHVRATLKGLAYLFENTINFDYVCLLTGQDYPIKSCSDIAEFLNKMRGKEFIDYFSLPSELWHNDDGGLRRIEHWHFRLHKKYICLPSMQKSDSVLKTAIRSILNRIFQKRALPGNFKLFGGSSYWCITRECAKFINNFVSKNSRFVNFFKYVNIPDEIFFHTIIMNSSFAENVVNDNLRLIVWSGGSGPQILRKADFELIAQSKGLMARKFDSALDSEILDLIDLKLL